MIHILARKREGECATRPTCFVSLDTSLSYVGVRVHVARWTLDPDENPTTLFDYTA